MSLMTIGCPECAGEVEVEEAMLGQRVKCPKCKESFTAEKAGLYDFVEDAKPKASSPSPPPRPSPAEAPRKGRVNRNQPVKPDRDTEPEALSDEMKSDLLSSMEKWAEE